MPPYLQSYLLKILFQKKNIFTRGILYNFSGFFMFLRIRLFRCPEMRETSKVEGFYLRCLFSVTAPYSFPHSNMMMIYYWCVDEYTDFSINIKSTLWINNSLVPQNRTLLIIGVPHFISNNHSWKSSSQLVRDCNFFPNIWLVIAKTLHLKFFATAICNRAALLPLVQ